METVRYKAPEITLWLQVASRGARKAKITSKESTVSGPDEISATLRRAAGAIVGFGRERLSELKQKQTEATEYTLEQDRLEARTLGRAKSLTYKDVVQIERKGGDRVVFRTADSSLTIAPVAHLVVGRVKAPIGWLRNGIEVPFETLIEEIAARSGKQIEEKGRG